MTISSRHITSLSNPEIKTVRSLAVRKYREKENAFLTEGLRHALDAAEAGWRFKTIVIEENALTREPVQKLIALTAGDTPLILSVSRAVMESIAKRDNAQTVMAVLEQRWAAPASVTNGLWIGLENIRDPGNLGTIIRTADAAGAAGIILIGETCDPFSSEAIRASMGSFAHVPLMRMDIPIFVRMIKEKSWPVIGTHLKGAVDFRTVSYQEDSFLLMGTEQSGLSDDLAAPCTHLIKIPMAGKADSLNVAVAASLAIYEIKRGSLTL